jgi:hypothetical protein
LPIVLWRVANQALNVTRESRTRLLEIMLDTARKCPDFYNSCNLSHSSRFCEPTFF